MGKGLRRGLAVCAVVPSLSGWLAGEARAAIPVAERAALIALYDSTNGAGWIDRTNWRKAGDTDFNDPGTECTWHGVTCSGDNVYAIALSFNNLSGPIPPELGSLGELTTLELVVNALTGSIPTQIGSLSKLEVLKLGQNQLSGAIPASLGNLAALRSLQLYSNPFGGAIPPELGTLANLEELTLSDNQLTGSIPASLGGLGSLRWLVLSRNDLSGSIPAAIGSLTSLEYLSLNENDLTGPIPPELGNLTALRYLYLHDNQLTGGIPAQLGQLANLETLWLGRNPLGGTIPPQLGALTKLKSALLWINQLSGPIPPELGGMASLEELLLNDNQLSGDIPASLWTIVSLRTLRLSSNQLTGSIPPAVGNLTALRELTLEANALSGPIPAEIGSLSNLTDLRLCCNQLDGPIPSQLGGLASVTRLSLSSNHLSGPIPPSLGNLTSVQHLELDGNQLEGTIPASLGGLSTLTWLYLGGNKLSGPIPGALASLTGISSIQLDWNALHSSDPALLAFLDDKAPLWENSQTVAPDGVAAGAAGTGSALLTWTPILFWSDDGGYRVRYGTTAGGPYTGLFGPTASKEVASAFVTGLAPDTTYYFVVETVTEPHARNQSTLVSELSAEVTVHTAPGPSVSYVLAVTKAGTGSGRVTSVPAGIDCGTDCSAAVVGDSVVTLTATPDQGSEFAGWGGGCTGTVPTCDVVVETADVAVTAAFVPPPPTAYYTVSPCRAFDSRQASLGGPSPLAAGSETSVMLAGKCEIPAGARAVSLNLTATQQTHVGHLRIYPQGVARPNVSMVNYLAGTNRANNAVVPLSATGELAVYVNQAGGSAHVVIDVNGYYAEAATGNRAEAKAHRLSP